MKKKIFFILLVIIVILVYKETNQNILIPDLSIRLRVIPNSNNPSDIAIKQEVKNYLEKNVYTITKNIDTIEEARNTIKKNIPTIENNIDKIFQDNNYNYSYNINYGLNYFPKKEYKGITYQEGYYESLIIAIGDAKGDNWWCVLFPNFCLIDTKEEHKYQSYLKKLFNKIF